MTTGILFLVALFLSPIFLAIPSFATAPALVIVGFFMASSIKKMEFDGDLADAVGGYLAFLMMPLTYLSQTVSCSVFWHGSSLKGEDHITLSGSIPPVSINVNSLSTNSLLHKFCRG